MKKVVLLVGCIAAFSISSNAQQGSWYIGGNAGYASSQNKVVTKGISVDGPKTSYWSFSPEVGTFLSNNIQLGVALNVTGKKSNYNNSNNTLNMFGGTVYGRYFFGGGAFRPFVGINISDLAGIQKTTDANSGYLKSKTMNLGANLNAGFAFALSPAFTAVGSFGALGFHHFSSKADGSDIKYINNTLGVDNLGTLGPRFTVGIYYTFSK